MKRDRKPIPHKFFTVDGDGPDAFHKNLDMLIEASGVTVRELADVTGIPFSTLSNILYGNSKDIKASTAVLLAKYFGISVDELLGCGTIHPLTQESLSYFRTLDEANLYTIRYLIRNLHHMQHMTDSRQKYINVFKPVCSHGHLLQTNVYEQVCIDSLSHDTKARVFMGLQMPCDHYMPFFSPYDILLIASDRDAKNGEICVILYFQRLFIVKKHIYTNDAGERAVEYLGIIDPQFKVQESEIDNKLGYLVEVFRTKVK